MVAPIRACARGCIAANRGGRLEIIVAINDPGHDREHPHAPGPICARATSLAGAAHIKLFEFRSPALRFRCALASAQPDDVTGELP